MLVTEGCLLFESLKRFSSGFKGLHDGLRFFVIFGLWGFRSGKTVQYNRITSI